MASRIAIGRWSSRIARRKDRRSASWRTLGELKADEQSGWAQFCQHLPVEERRAKSPQLSLFEPPAPEPARDGESVRVRLKDVRLERTRDFGEVWLAWGRWRLLQLDQLLTEVLESGRAEVPWSTMAAILTIARLCEPASELHIEETWYRRTALDDLLGVPAAKVHTDRLYECLDRLLPHK